MGVCRSELDGKLGNPTPIRLNSQAIGKIIAKPERLPQICCYCTHTSIKILIHGANFLPVGSEAYFPLPLITDLASGPRQIPSNEFHVTHATNRALPNIAKKMTSVYFDQGSYT